MFLLESFGKVLRVDSSCQNKETVDSIYQTTNAKCIVIAVSFQYGKDGEVEMRLGDDRSEKIFNTSDSQEHMK
jgi:FAD synthase